MLAVEELSSSLPNWYAKWYATSLARPAAARYRAGVMHVVGSRELRPRLGEYLERAKDGDEVVVLVYGQPAALLRAVRPDDVGALVPSRFVRDELHEVIGKARATSLVVTWHGRMFAVLQAPPEGLEVQEDVS
jgi:prevent-host-death family protein